MKFFIPLTLVLAASGLCAPLRAQDATPAAPAASAPPAAPAASAPPEAFTTDKEKLSYSIGADIARSFKQQNIEVDAQTLFAGFRDMTAGGQMQMTPDQMTASMRQMQQSRMAKAQAAAAATEAEGTKFLADNKSKPGVVTLPDGLQYKVLTEGTGPMPKATNTVSVNYRGTLINGTEFDSSYKRNEPASFQVDGVIKGWTEILQMMKVGAKYQVFIPSNLAYGERSPSKNIPPNSTLIFEVELLSVK